MARYLSRLSTLRHDDKGATAIEYGLIASLVSVVIIVALQAVGDNLIAAFSAVATALGGP